MTETSKEQKLKRALKWIIGIFDKYDIPYQITGGFAAHIYGATRPINDIDIDLPEAGIDKIVPDVKGYIVKGPMQYKDDWWDLYYMLLDYQGQEIDLGGLKVKIFDHKTKEWVESPVNLSTSKQKAVKGIKVNVVDPMQLINYKQFLWGEHQKRDIEEIELKLKSLRQRRIHI